MGNPLEDLLPIRRLLLAGTVQEFTSYLDFAAGFSVTFTTDPDNGAKTMHVVGAGPVIHEITASYHIVETSGTVYVGISGAAADVLVYAPPTPTAGMKIVVALEDDTLAAHAVTFVGNGHNVQANDVTNTTHALSTADYGTAPAIAYIFNGSVWKLLGAFRLDGAALQSATAGAVGPRIHLVGDSNTFGSNGDGTGHVGGWRHGLERILRDWRSDFEFVGSNIDTPESNAPGLWFNDGHPGFKIEDITAAYAGYLASAGVGTPDVILVMLGTNNIAAGDLLATLETKYTALAAQLDTSASNAKVIFLSVLPLVAGTTTGVNQAAWDAVRVSANTWLKNTFVPSKGGRYSFLDVSTTLGQGDFQSDGVHLNLQGQSAVSEIIAMHLDTKVLGRRTKPSRKRSFRQRQPWYSLRCDGTGNGASVVGNTGFTIGTSSFVFALDYYPTSLDANALHTVAQFGSYAGGAPQPFWGLYQQGSSLRLYFANGGGTVINLPNENCLALGKWHRIVVIADFATLTVGLYVNGQCVGVAQGVTAWNITAGTFYLGDGPSFTGAPGYYSRAHAYVAATVPRPGSMAALLAVENDYYLGEAVVASGLTAGYDLNNSLTVGYYNQPTLVLAGTAGFVAGAPSGTPIRPWELGAELGQSPWTPAQLGGLVAWFDSSDDRIVLDTTGLVETWPDKSGNHYDAVQATGANRPGFKTGGPRGAPWIDYPAASNTYGLTAPIPALALPYTVIIIGRFTSQTTQYMIDFNPTGTGLIYIATGTTTLKLNDGVDLVCTPNLTASADALIEAQVAASPNASIDINNNAAVTGNAGAGVAGGAGMGIGQRYGFLTTGLQGARLYEVIVLSKTMSAQERTSLRAYVAAKYAITT